MKNNNTSLPNFIHPEVAQLYNLDCKDAEPVFANLLELPRETLVKDLELTLKDGITRYENELRDSIPEDFDWATTNFPVYALFLLEELKAKESLPAIFAFLSYEDDQLFDIYLGDVLGELLWQIFYNLENQYLNLYESLLFNPKVFSYIKTEVSVLAYQLVLHHPERKQEIVQWYEGVLKHFLAEENPDYETLVALIISDLIDIKAVELLPQIEQLFEKDLVDYSVNGDFEMVKTEMDSTYGDPKRELLDYSGKLKFISDFFGNDEDFPQSTKDFFDESLYQQPIIKEPKIGRNDPCPCGSGKKYKKCCGINS